jgi:hypothetical protein
LFSFSVEIASDTGPVVARVSCYSFLRSFSASSIKSAGDFSISRRFLLIDFLFVLDSTLASGQARVFLFAQ